MVISLLKACRDADRGVGGRRGGERDLLETVNTAIAGSGSDL